MDGTMLAGEWTLRPDDRLNGHAFRNKTSAGRGWSPEVNINQWKNENTKQTRGKVVTYKCLRKLIVNIKLSNTRRNCKRIITSPNSRGEKWMRLLMGSHLFAFCVPSSCIRSDVGSAWRPVACQRARSRISSETHSSATLRRRCRRRRPCGRHRCRRRGPPNSCWSYACDSFRRWRISEHERIRIEHHIATEINRGNPNLMAKHRGNRRLLWLLRIGPGL